MVRFIGRVIKGSNPSRGYLLGYLFYTREQGRYGCADPRLAVGFRLIRGVKCMGGDVLFGVLPVQTFQEIERRKLPALSMILKHFFRARKSGYFPDITTAQ